MDLLWPARPAEKASDSLKDYLQAVGSDRGRHLKSSGLTCLCLSTCAHTVMCMHRGVTLSWEHRLENKNMNLVMEQGSFQDVGSYLMLPVCESCLQTPPKTTTEQWPVLTEVPLPSSFNLSSFDSNRTRKERILQICDMHSYFKFCISLKIFCELEISRLKKTKDFVEMDWGAPHLSLASNSQSFWIGLSRHSSPCLSS